MGCSHKKAVQIVECVYVRKKPTIVDDDRLILKWCPSCGAVSQDLVNIYCYSRGRWSAPDALVTLPGKNGVLWKFVPGKRGAA